MSFKVVKVVAVPVVLGFASIRVYVMSEAKKEHLLSPQELSIYSAELQGELHYVEEKPGALQSGFGSVRGGLQSYAQNIKSAFVSAKATAVNLYHGGEDIYHFLKDPPSEFVSRVAVITVSCLGGVILARQGSRLKKVMLPLSLATAGFAVCYPVQTISILKVSGKKIYAASWWTSSTVAALWKSPVAVPAGSELVPSSETVAKALTSQTMPTDELETTEKEEGSQEVPPPTVPNSTPMSEAQTASVPPSVSVLTQAYEREHTVSSTEDELLLVTDEGEISPASCQTIHSKPETSRLQTSKENGASTERQHRGIDLKLMDFGQSHPEDADLYSTRS